MTENLNKRPRKSILKSSSSFDKPAQAQAQAQAAALEHSNSKCTKFDEMNIIETFHPADKDYGHMKIEEPKTPFRYLEENSETLDAEVLKERISAKLNSPPRGAASQDWEESPESEEEVEEPTEGKKVFETKRKAHYNEYAAVKLARKLMEEDEEEEDGNPEGAVKFIPAEEVEIMEEA